MLQINYYKFTLCAVLCQLIIAAASVGSYNIPAEYTCDSNECVFGALNQTVKEELHIVEYTKNLGHNTTEESISIVLQHDEMIKEASKKYNVPRQMIQAVLFKELRMIDFRDDISDKFVDNCFIINRNLSESQSIDFVEKFIIHVTDTTGSSTGIGQIFPETAIKAHNWYMENYKNSNKNKLNYYDTRQREDIWRALQNDETCIDYMALILKYEAEHTLNVDINDNEEKDLIEIFIKYNGASYYGYEVLKYYKLFCQLETANIQSPESSHTKTSLD